MLAQNPHSCLSKYFCTTSCGNFFIYSLCYPCSKAFRDVLWYQTNSNSYLGRSVLLTGITEVHMQ